MLPAIAPATAPMKVPCSPKCDVPTATQAAERPVAITPARKYSGSGGSTAAFAVGLSDGSVTSASLSASSTAAGNGSSAALRGFPLS
jgi:hypothetical protein